MKSKQLPLVLIIIYGCLFFPNSLSAVERASFRCSSYANSQTKRVEKCSTKGKCSKKRQWAFSLGFSSENATPMCYNRARPAYYLEPSPRAIVGSRVYYDQFHAVPILPPPPCIERVVIVPLPTPVYPPNEMTKNDFIAIQNIYDAGGLIELEDGSIWKISSQSQSRVRHWQREDQIEISRTKKTKCPFKLLNINSREGAEAELISGSSLQCSSQTQVEGNSRKSTLAQNLSNGEILRFADNSLWDISPGGQYTTRLWCRNESIEITRNDQYSYPFTLKNLNTNESVDANFKKPSY